MNKLLVESSSRFERVSKAIIEFVVTHPNATEPEITVAIPFRIQTVAKALRMLVSEGIIDRIGSGVKGDPYKYFLRVRSDPKASAIGDEGVLI